MCSICLTVCVCNCLITSRIQNCLRLSLYLSLFFSPLLSLFPFPYLSPFVFWRGPFSEHIIGRSEPWPILLFYWRAPCLGVKNIQRNLSGNKIISLLWVLFHGFLLHFPIFSHELCHYVNVSLNVFRIHSPRQPRGRVSLLLQIIQFLRFHRARPPGAWL